MPEEHEDSERNGEDAPNKEVVMEERESAEIKNRRAKLAKLRIQWAENQRQINELEELLKFRYNTPSSDSIRVRGEMAS